MKYIVTGTVVLFAALALMVGARLPAAAHQTTSSHVVAAGPAQASGMRISTSQPITQAQAVQLATAEVAPAASRLGIDVSQIQGVTAQRLTPQQLDAIPGVGGFVLPTGTVYVWLVTFPGLGMFQDTNPPMVLTPGGPPVSAPATYHGPVYSGVILDQYGNQLEFGQW